MKITDFTSKELTSAVDSVLNPFATQNQERHERLIIEAVQALASHLEELEEGYSVVATVGTGNPEARVGVYSTRFEADAVAKAWNKINNKHGVTYRVEVDW